MEFTMFRSSCALMAATLTLVGSASAQTYSLSYDGPSVDRWMYPFNPTPGVRITASTFSSYPDPQFDDRDGQFIVGFTTASDVPTGLGSESYSISSAVLRVQIATDLAFAYDATADSYRGYLSSDDPEYQPDADPGEPIELFGTGFRNGFTAASFAENSPYSPFGPFGQGIRNAFALGHDESSAPIDVSLSVTERFDPVPFATGAIDSVTPGDLVPAGSVVKFSLDVANPDVQAYLRDAVDQGRLLLTVTSLTRVVQMGGSFPSYFCREHPNVPLNIAEAAQLEMVVVVGSGCEGDVDGSGAVTFADLLSILAAWDSCIDCPEDLNDDGEVGFDDLLIVLSAWGPCP